MSFACLINSLVGRASGAIEKIDNRVVAYYSIKGASGAVKAESCDECGTYLKIAYMDKDPHVDPIADDLATLALDLMMDDSGKFRSGPNLFLMTAADSAE